MTTKMNVSRKVYSDIEVMNWLKNIQGFKDNTFPQEWVDEMKCVTYEDWCNNWVDESGIKPSNYLMPYIDFQRLLITEYYDGEENEQVLFCIGYNSVGDLRTFQNPTEDDEIVYVCSMPLYKLAEDEDFGGGTDCWYCGSLAVGCYTKNRISACIECRDENKLLEKKK
jgi:hypothetical protein